MAFFGMSRSIRSCSFSRRSRAISASEGSDSVAALDSAVWARSQRRSVSVTMPRSRAAWLAVSPCSVTSRTACWRNSSGYGWRVPVVAPRGGIAYKVSTEAGQGQGARRLMMPCAARSASAGRRSVEQLFAPCATLSRVGENVGSHTWRLIQDSLVPGQSLTERNDRPLPCLLARSCVDPRLRWGRRDRRALAACVRCSVGVQRVGDHTSKGDIHATQAAPYAAVVGRPRPL